MVMQMTQPKPAAVTGSVFSLQITSDAWEQHGKAEALTYRRIFKEHLSQLTHSFYAK